MKILTTTQMKKLMGEFPNGGIVFAEYIPNMPASSLMVTDGNFGAREVVPRDGGVFDFDWNIDEYEDERQFAVFDNNDILQMIQTLTSGLKIHLKDWFEDDETEHDFINDRMTERFNKQWVVVGFDYERAREIIKNIINQCQKEVSKIIQNKQELWVEFTDGTALHWFKALDSTHGQKFGKMWCDKTIDSDVFKCVVLPCYRGRIEDICWI